MKRSPISRRTWCRGIASVVLAGLLGGCGGQPQPPAPDSDAAKRELEQLQRQRQKEWQGEKGR